MEVKFTNVEVAMFPYQVEVAREPVISPVAERLVKEPAAFVDPPMVTPSRVDVERLP